MERLKSGFMARVLSTAVAVACLGTTLFFASSPTPAAASDSYLGSVVDGRGTVLGSAAYAPPTGAIYASASTGADSNPGTLNSPVKTVARALSLAPAGGTVVLRAGSYHESVTVSKQVTIQNYPREVVWFDGSRAVSNWTRNGSVWTAPWNTFFSPSNYGSLRSDFPYASYPAQVFVDGSGLKEVGSASAVVAGTFFADSVNKRLIVGTDPSGRDVVSSDLDRAIMVLAKDVNLRGFGVHRYATTSSSRGAILMDSAGGTFENLVVSDNASVGMNLSGANKTIRAVTVERNGMIGLGMNAADNVSISYSVFRYNNSERFPAQPTAAGIKITRSASPKVERSLISDNYLTSGLWFDVFCSNVVVVNNSLLNNGELQLNLELSTKGIVANNQVAGGRKGIELRDTDHVKVMNNHVSGYSLMGMFLVQDDRWKNTGGDAPSGFSLLTNGDIIANNVIGCGTRFQLFGNDESARLAVDDFNLTISGNLFTPQLTNPELNLMGWGLGNNKYDFIQTPQALAKKNSGWKNLQSSTCIANPETTVTTTALQSVAMEMPADVASVLGVSKGTKAVGLIAGTSVAGAVATTTPTATPTTTPTTTPTATPTTTPKAANSAPTAVITSSKSGLKATFDGKQSSDRDGTVAAYAWNFGDGSSATGRSATHTYSAAGSYLVSLTVSDDQGATGKATATISVTAPAVRPGTTLIDDPFQRTVKKGWGTSKNGQTWAISGGNSQFSVSGGKGRVALQAGYTREAYMPGVVSSSIISKTKLSLSRVPTAGSAALTIVGRKSGATYYGARVVVSRGGKATFYVLQGETSLGSYSMPKYKAGKALYVRLSVSGTSPTTIKAKVWAAGKSEPKKWRIEATDATASLQTSGVTGVRSYLNASARPSTRFDLFYQTVQAGPVA